MKLIEFTEILYGSPDNAYSEVIKKELELKIMNLKPVYKEIIIAIDFEGYTYKELSEELEIPVGTLMSRRHRALGILLRKIENKK